MSSLQSCQYTVSTARGASVSVLYRPLLRNRNEKRYPTHARQLWWWSRHSTWNTPSDENVEDRMQKYQKIMRYRYSRALRRRAMWERDNSPPQWCARGSVKWLSPVWRRKPISTSGSHQAKLNDDDTSIPRSDQHWDQAQRDFETFKAEVDRAIAKDPVGFLFGRRLQGPPSANNSSWTSFARLFDSKESQDSFETNHSPKRIKIENLNSKKATVNPGSIDEQSRVSTFTQSQSTPESAYIFDPISGRNVPRASSPTESTQSSIGSVLGDLFAEHGVPPDKTTSKSVKVDQNSTEKKFESSRKYEYRQLRSASLGNNIDTAAAFSGKYEVHHNPQESDIKIDSHTSPEISDDAPPFTGTTYESSRTVLPQLSSSPSSSSNSSWLEHEGFRSKTSTSTSTDHNEKLQSSFDRMQEDGQAARKTSTIKLQPAIDRVNTLKPKIDSPSPQPPLHVGPGTASTKSDRPVEDLHVDTREDLDLLRPSDVRAATRSARITKERIRQEKQEIREGLEADFTRREADSIGGSKEYDNSSARFTRALPTADAGSITQHVQQYPQGVVAQTVQAISSETDRLGSSSSLKLQTANLMDQTRTSPDELANIPPADKKTSISSVIPDILPEEVSEAYRATAKVTQTLRNLNKEAQAMATVDSYGIRELGSALREAYESERGLIGLESEIKTPRQKEAGEVSPKPSLLRTASVKPGVPRYPHIERHTQEFEPKLVALREQAKGIKRSLYEIGTTLQQLKKGNATASPNDAKNQHLAAHESLSASNSSTRQLASDEKQRLNAMRALNARIAREPHLLEKPVLRLQRSKESKAVDESSSSTVPQTQHEALGPPLLPWVLLTYNKNTGDVDFTQLNNLIGQDNVSTTKINPIMVMGQLNYPAAFVSHFVTLEKAGYSLVNGGGDLLIFRRQGAKNHDDGFRQNAFKSIRAIKSDINEIRNKIAAEEANHQPSTEVKSHESNNTTNVVDEIPIPHPAPGPSISISPPTSSAAREEHNGKVHIKRHDRKSRRIRRQEDVFSGTIRPSVTTAEAAPIQDWEGQSFSSSTSQPSLLQRLGRTVRKIVLTTIALGIGAYSIGIVAEGIGAHAQAAHGVAGVANEDGPRKKVVMPMGQRPGIDSTESSRN